MENLKAESVFKLLVCMVLVSPSLGLFYTNSRENDYPRIGKRLKQLGKHNSGTNINYNDLPSDITRLLGYEYNNLHQNVMEDHDQNWEVFDPNTDSAQIDDLEDSRNVMLKDIDSVIPEEQRLYQETVSRAKARGILGRNNVPLVAVSPVLRQRLLRENKVGFTEGDEMKLFNVLKQDDMDDFRGM